MWALSAVGYRGDSRVSGDGRQAVTIPPVASGRLVVRLARLARSAWIWAVLSGDPRDPGAVRRAPRLNAEDSGNDDRRPTLARHSADEVTSNARAIETNAA